MRSLYGSTPKTPEIEVGSEYVTVRDKLRARTARILRAEQLPDGARRLTLDRLLDRNAGKYAERVGDFVQEWSASGAFVTELICQAPVDNDAEDDTVNA